MAPALATKSPPKPLGADSLHRDASTQAKTSRPEELTGLSYSQKQIQKVKQTKKTKEIASNKRKRKSQPPPKCPMKCL